MKKTIKNLLVISIFIILICISGIVKADTATMSLSSNSSQFKAGDTIIVTLNISAVNSPSGLSGIMGTLEYDENVFEEVTEDSFEGLNKWNFQGYNGANGAFTLLKNDPVKSASELVKISLRVKSSVSADSTTITIKNMEIGADDEDVDVIKPTDVSVRLTKSTGVTPTTTPTPSTTPSKTPTTTPTPSAKATATPTPSGKLPQTGEETVYVVLGMAVLLVISTISFIKYNNLKIR